MYVWFRNFLLHFALCPISSYFCEDYGHEHQNAQEQQNKNRKVEEIAKDLLGTIFRLDVFYPLTLNDLKGSNRYCLL